MSYTLTPHKVKVERTTWWKDENHPEESTIWWITGHGVNRPANDIEIALWLRKDHCQKLSFCGRESGHEGRCNTSVEWPLAR